MSPAMILAIVGIVCNVIALLAMVRSWFLHKSIVSRLAAERDAALRQKSEQWETWQAEATNLRRDVAALEERLEAARRRRNEDAEAARTAIDELVAEKAVLRVDLTTLRHNLASADAELALLRPIAAAAHKFMDGDHVKGEWREVREALKPWAEREGKS